MTSPGSRSAICNCSITPDNSAWIAERAGVRRYDFVDNAQHFQVIPTKVGIQMFFFGVRLPCVIKQLQGFSFSGEALGLFFTFPTIFA
jgi:hypothetical protein